MLSIINAIALILFALIITSFSIYVSSSDQLFGQLCEMSEQLNGTSSSSRCDVGSKILIRCDYPCFKNTNNCSNLICGDLVLKPRVIHNTMSVSMFFVAIYHITESLTNKSNWMFKLANLSLSVVLLGKYIIFDMRHIGKYGDEMDKNLIIVGLFSIILLSASVWHYTLWVVSTISRRCVCLFKTLSALSSILTVIFSLILSVTILVLNTNTYPGFFKFEDSVSIKADKVISRVIFALNVVLMMVRGFSKTNELIVNDVKNDIN